ncbi:hypothetical protein [Adlercreutzia sp. ZJ473]|uniref:hypothetical protein n=1 Tax=Adlercreutzia sp. ZJ473 TaxID=2722822 RepID=UPI00155645FB|nr:hypothetical protein [Adlercreutzia sp. ZJ473]
MENTRKAKGFLALGLAALLVACALALCAALPQSAWAAGETATATTGRTITKDTTQEELNTWAGEGAIEITKADDVTTVKLLKNFNFPNGKQPITFGDVLAAPDDVMVLDLNGRTISSTTIAVQSGCNLTIRDSAGRGKIFMDTSSNDKAAFGAVINQRKLTIESGTFEAQIHESNSTTGVIGSAVAGVETVINGGTFESNCSAISVTSGTTTVNGGVFNAGTYGVVSRHMAVVEFPASSQAAVTSKKVPIVAGKRYTSDTTAGQVHVAGGYFEGTNTAALVGKLGDVTATELVKITGGTFADSPVGYVEASIPVVQKAALYKVGAGATAFVEGAVAGDALTFYQHAADITVAEGVQITNSTGAAITVNGKAVENGGQVTATHRAVKTDEKKATCTEAGNIAYWHCSICGKYYSDEACTQEVTLEGTVVPAAGHKTEGGKWGSDWASHWALCDVCDVKVGEAEPHKFVEGACSVCAAVDPTYVPVSVEGEGDVDATEETAAAEVAASTASSVVEAAIGDIGKPAAEAELVKEGVVSAETYEAVQQAVQAGQTIDVVVEATPVLPEDVSAGDKDKVAAVVTEGGEIAQYLDLSVILKAGNKEIGVINKLDEPVKFTVAIPADLVKDGRTFYVVRVHDGKAERLATTVKDGFATFETDLFSTYALAYEDVAPGGQPVVPGGQPAGPDAGGQPAGPTTDQPATDQPADAKKPAAMALAKTGDPVSVAALAAFAVALAAAAVCVVAAFRRRSTR